MRRDAVRPVHGKGQGSARSLGAATLWALIALLCYLAARDMNMNPRRAELVRLDNVQMQGFEAADGRLRSRGNDSASFHLLGGDAPFASNGYYVFSLKVGTVPGAPAKLVVDLYGDGYDSPAQERQFQLLPGQRDVRVSGRINAGQAPANATFRVFYSGPEGLVLEDLRVARLTAWRVYLERVLGLLLVIAGGYWCWQVAAWFLRPGQATASVPVTWLLLAVAFVACARFLLQVALPYWSGDEYLYKSIASGIWAGGRAGIPSSSQVLHDTNLPNLLYGYWIAPAFAAGENFYIAIRAINAVTMALGVIPLYFIALRFMQPSRALLSAIIGMALPSLFLGAFAVTEALYFPLFLLAVQLLLTLMDRQPPWYAPITFGICLAVLLNVRLNAIILAPAVVLCTLLAQSGDWRGWIRRPYWLASLVVAALGYLLLKHLLTNPDSDGLGFYQNRSGGWASTALRMAMQDPSGTLKMVLGHLTLLGLPFAPAIAATLALPWMRIDSEEAARRRNLMLAVLLIVALSVAMAIVFTLGVAPQDIGGLGRWHSRYYFAALPLLVVLALADPAGWSWTRNARVAYVGAFCVFIASAVLFVVIFKLSANPWFGSTVDSMEAHWYKVAAGLFPWLLLALLLAGAALMLGRREAAIALLLIWLGIANLATLKVLTDGPGADDPQCGRLATQLVARAPGPVAAVVSSRESLVDNLFWLPYLPREARFVEPGERIDVSELPGDTYILSDPRVTITGAELIEHTGNCRIYRAN